MSGGDRVIRAGLWLSLTVVTLIAVCVSYGHLYELAKRYGERSVAAAALPVTVDGLILACTLVIWRAARDRSRPPVLAMLMLVVGIAATLAGNIAHGVSQDWPGALVAAWPALVAAACFHLLVGEIRRGRSEIPCDSQGIEGIEADLPQFSDDSEPWTGDEWTGWDQWSRMPAIAPEDREPAIATVAPDTPPEIEGESPSDPELAPVLATARDRFAEMLAAGHVPSIRAIRRECKIGHPKAVAVREALGAG